MLFSDAQAFGGAKAEPRETPAGNRTTPPDQQSGQSRRDRRDRCVRIESDSERTSLSPHLNGSASVCRSHIAPAVDMRHEYLGLRSCGDRARHSWKGLLNSGEPCCLLCRGAAACPLLEKPCAATPINAATNESFSVLSRSSGENGATNDFDRKSPRPARLPSVSSPYAPACLWRVRHACAEDNCAA
jgi:hypothetical protein